MFKIAKRWIGFITIVAVLTSTIYLTVSANDYNNEYEKIGLVIEKFSDDISEECYDPEIGISVMSCDSNGMYVCIRNNVTLSDRYLFVDYAGNIYERDTGLPAIFSDGIAAINTDGVISTWDNNDNYGYIDENYNWIREPDNHIVSSASEGYVLIGDKGKQFLIDDNGRPCFVADRFCYNSPLSVTEMGKVFSKGRAVCEKNDRFYFVNKDLNCVEFAAKADGWESCDYSGGTAVITKSKPDDYAVGTEKYISEMYNSAGTCVYKHELSVSDDEYDSSSIFPKVLSNGYAIFPMKDNDAASENQQNKFPKYDLIMVSPDGEEIETTDKGFRASNLQSLGANILFDESSGTCYDMNFEKLLEPDNRNIYCCDLNGDVAVTVKQEEDVGEKVILEFTVIHPREVELNRAVRVVDPDKVKPVEGKNEVLTDCICIDNEAINFNLPIIEENDRILVPMRRIFEELGAEVTWDNDTNTATAVKDNTEIKITVDSDIMLKNGGQTIKLDAPARLVDDAYTYVPLRAVSEAFEYTVIWSEELNRVDIITVV